MFLVSNASLSGFKTSSPSAPPLLLVGLLAGSISSTVDGVLLEESDCVSTFPEPDSDLDEPLKRMCGKNLKIDVRKR